MKKLFIPAVFALAYCFPAFSQTDDAFPKSQFQIKPWNEYSLNDSTLTFRIGKPYGEKKLVLPDRADIQFKFGQKYGRSNMAPEVIDNMPCVKPQGNYPALPYEVDSTANYTLLKKDLAKVW
ncbi:hypothetical protein [Negadavirga shengliensis]|uniref:Uncharacterized protein n=1 Tax=Negadavirga shengliensis TaxID=1389218 RepID=A0ABV9T6S0_9BACT